MTIDIVDRLMHPTHFEEFMLFSADSDFTPVLQKLGIRPSDLRGAGRHDVGRLSASADEILQLAELLEKCKAMPEIRHICKMSICNSILQHRAQNIPSGRCAQQACQHR